MGKSDFKKVLHSMAPHCLQLGEPQRAKAVIHDTIVDLRKWGHSALKRYDGVSTVHIDQIVYDLFQPALSHYPNATLHVHLFDKASFVTRAKESEQSARDQQIHVIEQYDYAEQTQQNKSCFDDQTNCFEFSLPKAGCSAAKWNAHINDRKFRQFLISKICERAAELLPSMIETAQVTCTIIIDFEHHIPVALGGGTEPKILAISNASEPLDASNQLCVPNKLGEFDVAFLHYVKKAFEFTNNGVVVVKTIDTDILPIAMVNYHSTFDMSTPGYYIQLPFLQNNYFFDVFACNTWAEATFKADRNENPIEKCALIYIHAGSDFVEGVAGITAENFVIDYIKNFLDFSPNEYKKRMLNSELAKLSGVRNATAKQKHTRKRTRPDECVQRANFTLNYWKHSVFETHKLFPSPLGHGFSLCAGKIVPTEQVKEYTRMRF